MGTFFLEIKCISLLVVCLSNMTDQPKPQLWYDTRGQCEKTLMALALNWNPRNGAYTFNCVRRG